MKPAAGVVIIIICICFSGWANALLEAKGFKPYEGFADLVVQAQSPVLWVYRALWHPELQSKTLTTSKHTYYYLYRKGELPGTVLMVHGILARKDFYLPLVSEWVKLNKPMPTIVIPDILAHGDDPYPSPPAFSVFDFANHLAGFIRAFQEQNSKQPLIILGHSLGAGIATLLKPYNHIHHDGIILVSPAGPEKAQTQDFMSEVEINNGLPFDFWDATARRFIHVCFEPMTLTSTVMVAIVSHIYSLLANPTETFMRNIMFQELIRSLNTLRQTKNEIELTLSNLEQPVYLIWALSDQLFAPDRYRKFLQRLGKRNNLSVHPVNGSHMWIYEHSPEAARLISNIVQDILKKQQRINN